MPATDHIIIMTNAVPPPALARASRSELGWKGATQNAASPGRLSAAYAIKAVHARESRRPASGVRPGRGARWRSEGRTGEAAVAKPLWGGTGSQRALPLPPPAGGREGCSSALSLLLSLCSLAESRSSTSCWSGPSSLFSWRLM